MAYRINLICGNSSIIRSKPTSAGYTHDWELFIKGVNNASIHNYIDKIVFHLHESFPNPVRTLNKPPYIIRESGYAGFEIPIDVYLRNNSEPRKFHFKYDLSLAKFQSAHHTITHTEIINNPSEEFSKKLRKGGATPISNSESVTEKKKSKSDQMVGKPRLSGNEPKKYKHEQKTTDTFNDVFGTPIKTGKLAEKKPTEKKLQPQSLFSDKPSKSEKTEKSDKSDKSLKTKHVSQKDKKPEKLSEDTKLKKDTNREKDVPKERSKVSTSPEDMKSEAKSSSSSTKDPKRHSDSSRDKNKEKSKDSSKSSTDEKRKDRSDRKKDKKKPKDEREREKKDKHRDRDRENERSKEASKSSDKKPEKETPAESKIPKDQIKSPKQDKSVAQTQASPVSAAPTIPPPVVSNDSNEKVKEHKHSKSDKDKHRKDDKDKSRDSNEKEKSRDISVEKEKSKKHKKRDKKDRKEDSSREKDRKERKEKYHKSSKSHKSPEPAPPTSQAPGFPDRLSSESAGSAEEEVVADKAEKVANAASKPQDIRLRSPSPTPEGQTRMSPPTPRDPYEQLRRRTKEKSDRKRERTDGSYERKQDRKRQKHESKDSSSERLPSKDSRGENSPLDESVSSSLSPMTMSSLITSKNSNTHVSNDAELNIEPMDVDSDDAAPDSTDSNFTATLSPSYLMQLQELQHKINALNDFDDLQRLIALITRTGHFEVTTQTVDFDLLHFDKKTIESLQDFFDNLS